MYFGSTWILTWILLSGAGCQNSTVTLIQIEQLLILLSQLYLQSKYFSGIHLLPLFILLKIFLKISHLFFHIIFCIYTHLLDILDETFQSIDVFFEIVVLLSNFHVDVGELVVVDRYLVDLLLVEVSFFIELLQISIVFEPNLSDLLQLGMQFDFSVLIMQDFVIHLCELLLELQ